MLGEANRGAEDGGENKNGVTDMGSGMDKIMVKCIRYGHNKW